MNEKLANVIVVSRTKLYRDTISDIVTRSDRNKRAVSFTSSDDAILFLNNNDVEAAFFSVEKVILDRVKDLGLLKSAFRHVRLAIIADRDDRRYTMAALQAGMHGYIPTTLSSYEFTQAIVAVCRGQVYLPPSIAHSPSPCKASSVYKEMSSDQLLTPRQQEIVSLIRTGMNNKEIAEKLGLSEGTVKVHNHNIFRKLGATRRSDFIT